MAKKPLQFNIIFLFILTMGVYSLSLFNGFVYDDMFTIVDNQLIRNWRNLSDFFSQTYFLRSGEETYRPAVTLTYFLDHALWQLNPLGYHLSNVLIHSANTVLLYWFFLLLPVESRIAILGAILYGVHPVHSEAVNAISYREDLLVVLFLLSAFIIFLKITRTSGVSKARRITLYSLSLVFYLIALLSKEMAVTFPLLLIGYIFCLKEKVGGKEQLSFIYLLTGYLVVTFGYLALYFGHFSNPHQFHTSHPDILIRLLTLPKVLVGFLWLIVLPWQLNADYVIQFSHSLFEFAVLSSILVLIGLGVAVMRRAYEQRQELFGFFWFFATLLPVMNIIPISNIMAERFLYLPFAGFSLLLSSWLINLYQWIMHQNSHFFLKKITIAALVLIVLSFSIRTVYRTLDWKDDFTLWSKTVNDSPESTRAHYNIAWFYENKGKNNNAIAHYKEAIRLAPKSYDAHYNLGLIYLRFDLLDEAEKEFKAVMGIKPDFKDTTGQLERIEYLKDLRRPNTLHQN